MLLLFLCDGSAIPDVCVDAVVFVLVMLLCAVVEAVVGAVVGAEGDDDDGGDVAEDADPSSGAFASTPMSGPVKLAFSGPMSL